MTTNTGRTLTANEAIRHLEGWHQYFSSRSGLSPEAKAEAAEHKLMHLHALGRGDAHATHHEGENLLYVSSDDSKGNRWHTAFSLSGDGGVTRAVERQGGFHIVNFEHIK